MSNKQITRREFLKRLGLGGAVAGTAALVGCSAKDAVAGSQAALGPIPKDKMTYRTNPSTGDKVSLLGYGCMRWPTMSGEAVKDKNASPEEAKLDQKAINRLVDFALEHGVNYFDTSPAYCQGQSERATGIALSRHPRNKYFIATKLSNFDPSTFSHDASVAMYRNSLKELQTDYIDYYLLHAVGMGDDGMEMLRKRYIDNGMLDFLLAEREQAESAISVSPITAMWRCSTICSQTTTNTNGTLCRFSIIIPTGRTPPRVRRSRNISTGSCRNVAYRLLSWSRC